MVAIVETFDSFVGLSLIITRQNVALGGYHRLRPFVVDTNNQVADSNNQILQIKVRVCSKHGNLTRQQIDLVAIDGKLLSCKIFSHEKRRNTVGQDRSRGSLMECASFDSCFEMASCQNMIDGFRSFEQSWNDTVGTLLSVYLFVFYVSQC